jgi:hypothetical protein
LIAKSANYSFQPQIDPRRIIAIWGFSEAALGGILHALKIPLTGMFVGGAAVIFITLLAHYSQKKAAILNATITVIVIKAIISPHSPLAAYFAVGLQGLLGYLFFSLIKIEKIAAVLLGFFALLFSALQKFIILTIIFGNTLWNSLDDFVNYILLQLNIDFSGHSISFSIILICVYSIVHVAFGIYFALKAAALPHKLEEKSYLLTEAFRNYLTEDIFVRKDSPKKKRWWKKKSGMVLIIFFISLMILTYFEPVFQKNRVYEILIMLLRSFVITFLWFVIISPFVITRFNKFIEKNKFERASEINRVTALFPEFKKIINYTWKSSADLKKFKRLRKFLSDSIILLLITRIENNA